MCAYDCVVCKDIALREQIVISEFLNFSGFCWGCSIDVQKSLNYTTQILSGYGEMVS
jgi:hypothetical protein